MASSSAKLYVGCSLTQAPESFRDEVEGLKDALRDQGHEVFDFVGLVAGTPNDVYKWDIGHCVGASTLFVAVCDYPSLGLGYELGTAVEQHHKPVLAVAHTDSQITRLVLGIDDPNFTFSRYENLAADVPPMVAAKLAAIGLSTELPVANVS
jgi:hypothetical protein